MERLGEIIDKKPFYTPINVLVLVARAYCLFLFLFLFGVSDYSVFFIEIAFVLPPPPGTRSVQASAVTWHQQRWRVHGGAQVRPPTLPRQNQLHTDEELCGGVRQLVGQQQISSPEAGFSLNTLAWQHIDSFRGFVFVISSIILTIIINITIIIIIVIIIIITIIVIIITTTIIIIIITFLWPAYPCRKRTTPRLTNKLRQEEVSRWGCVSSQQNWFWTSFLFCS